MVVTWQTVITLGSIVGAVALVLKYYNRGYDLIKHQREQDAEIKAIHAKMEKDAESRRVLTHGVLACLQGLHEQGCNGAVTEAISELQDYLSSRI